MKRTRIKLSTHVCGELRRAGLVIEYEYGKGEHTAMNEREELVFEHLIEIGTAKPIQARKRRRTKEDQT